MTKLENLLALIKYAFDKPSRDFNFTATLGPGLVPVLPLRINFMLYMNDFVKSLKLSPNFVPTLVDLGCGPVAIFSVLGTGCAKNLGLKQHLKIEKCFV